MEHLAYYEFVGIFGANFYGPIDGEMVHLGGTPVLFMRQRIGRNSHVAKYEDVAIFYCKK